MICRCWIGSLKKRASPKQMVSRRRHLSRLLSAADDASGAEKTLYTFVRYRLCMIQSLHTILWRRGNCLNQQVHMPGIKKAQKTPQSDGGQNRLVSRRKFSKMQ